MSDALQIKMQELQTQLEVKIQAVIGPSFIEKAAAHSLLAPCKRIRPLLLLLGADALQVDIQKAWAPAIALELIHTYSLIHDDLPCMDDDDLRRGRPSLHKVYGDAIATLSGDYLLTHAFEIIASSKQLSESEKVAIIQLFANKSGSEGMIGGQVMDLQSEEKQISLEELQTMHELKTSALFEAAFEAVAIINENKDREKLKTIGKKLGLCFQITDDILDLIGNDESLGKPSGSDLKNKKSTYVQILGLEKAEQLATELHNNIIDLLKDLSLENSCIPQVCHKVLHRLETAKSL